MRRVLQSYIYTLTSRNRIKGKAENALEVFAKFRRLRLEFIRKIMYSLVNVENY